MDYKDLMALIDHLDQSTVSYVDYQTGSHHLVLSKEVPQVNLQKEGIFLEEEAPFMQPTLEFEVEEQKSLEGTKASELPKEKVAEVVKSPMVGVAYLQGNPDEDPYVKVGDYVEQGDVICLIEAMKLMNEIQAPHSGTVTEILIENEEVVEFDQELIRIEK